MAPTDLARPGAASRGCSQCPTVLLAILAVVLYPLVWMLGTSFKSHDGDRSATSALCPEEFTPGNYPDGWTSIATSASAGSSSTAR